MYLNNKKLVTVLSFLTVMLLSSCGIENNGSFNLTQGKCADGTTNAPYCMAIQLSNNSGGQNYINSTNYAFENLKISVINPEGNLNYPVTQGSALDPSGCINSTIKPGGSCTFYVQLSGESVPVGSSSPITINASYKINNNLFGGGGSTYSSSVSFYQKPNLAVSNVNGLVINYSQTGLQSAFSAESGSIPVNANTNDNYYGFLYLATNSGLFLSGNAAFAYNKAESLNNINNITISNKIAYPISSSSIYSGTINPINNIRWSSFATAASNLQSNSAITALGRVVVATSSNLYTCSSSSSAGGCTPEGVSLSGTIQKLQYTVLGSSTSGSLMGAQLTGLVVGASNGLFVESGTPYSSSNQWLPVYVSNNPVVSNIVSMTEDNLGNIFAIDNNGAIYKLAFNGGNTASLQDNLVAGSGAPIAITYDNAGRVLYVITDSGNLYGCTNNGTHLDCSGAPVARNIFTGAAFGLNIITSLYTGSI